MNYNSQYYVYIMSNSYNTVLYIGFTNDLMRRVMEHHKGAIEGFSKKYHCHKLVYYEEYDMMVDAKKREKQLKEWNRAWKDELINKMNPTRKDLSENWDKEGFICDSY